MPDSEAAPLLRAPGKAPSAHDELSTETTPLVPGGPPTDADAHADAYDDSDDEGAAERGLLAGEAAADHPDASDDDDDADVEDTSKKRQSTFGLASLVAIGILSALCLLIAFGAFVVPDRVQDYAKQAVVVEPTNLAFEAITDKGVRARIQANFRLDGSRVKDAATRRIGRAVTSIVRQLGTDATTVSVYLSDYSNALVGTAALPPLAVSVVDGHATNLNIVTELTAGDAEALRIIANKWLEGKLDVVRVEGKAWVPVRSGVLSLGNHSISEPMVFQGKDVPTLPAYDISGLNISEIIVPGQDRKAIRGEVVAHTKNPWPVELSVPALGFQVMVPNCRPGQDPIHVLDATTEPVLVRPKSDVAVSASGVIQDLSKALTKTCPGGKSSPLDHVMEQYLHGEAASFFVRGRGLDGTPGWIADIMSRVTIPVAFPGREFDNLVRNFSLADLEFVLPDPFTNPDDPNDGKALVSGTLEVVAALPREMNFEANVTSVRASADLFYEGKKLGELQLDRWQPARSTRIEPDPRHKGGDAEALLRVTSHVKDVPLDITDGEVFADVMSRLLFGDGDGDVVLGIKATVDGTVQTALGDLVIKGIPTEGSIPVKPLPGNGLGALQPQIGDLRVLGSTHNRLEVEALINLTNPTPYSGYVPYVNVHLYKNGSRLGDATAEHVRLVRGDNTNIRVRGTWDPAAAAGGEDGDDTDAAREVGRNLISEYISGFNVTLVAKSHRESIPRLPIIGESLSRLNVSIQAPTIRLPSDDDSDGGHSPPDGDDDGRRHSPSPRFIRDATFHILSSSATFTLASPLEHDTLFIERVDAVALYNHTDPVGAIFYDDLPFPVSPGLSRTPHLPVDWSLDSVGYDRLTEALGGRLRLDARANVTVRLGRFREEVWYRGRGIGASVRL